MKRSKEELLDKGKNLATARSMGSEKKNTSWLRYVSPFSAALEVFYLLSNYW